MSTLVTLALVAFYLGLLEPLGLIPGSSGPFGAEALNSGLKAAQFLFWTVFLPLQLMGALAILYWAWFTGWFSYRAWARQNVRA